MAGYADRTEDVAGYADRTTVVTRVRRQNRSSDEVVPGPSEDSFAVHALVDEGSAFL